MAQPIVDLEIMFPCHGKVDANACWKEVPSKDDPCCADIDNPRIITKGNALKVDVNWNAVGSLFSWLANGNWYWNVEVRLEAIGSAANANVQNSAPPVLNTGPGAYAATVIFPYGGLTPGEVYRMVVLLHLEDGTNMAVCGFKELGTIHVQ